MAEAPTDEPTVAGLMMAKKDLEARLKEVEKDHKELTDKLLLTITGVNAQLRAICEHEWKRDNHAYAELYCKHCGIWH